MLKARLNLLNGGTVILCQLGCYSLIKECAEDVLRQALVTHGSQTEEVLRQTLITHGSQAEDMLHVAKFHPKTAWKPDWRHASCGIKSCWTCPDSGWRAMLKVWWRGTEYIFFFILKAYWINTENILVKEVRGGVEPWSLRHHTSALNNWATKDLLSDEF